MKKGLTLLLMISLLPCTGALASPLPSSFDLRDVDGRSYIGPVRSQGDCGSCYSFGAVAAAESSLNLRHNFYDDKALDLSEAFIVWSLSPLYEGFHGCNGSNYDYEELTGLIEYGIPLEKDFPYTTVDPGDDLHWDAPRYTFKDWYRIPPNDIETTKRVIYNLGAVDAAVLCDGPFLLYKEGIFENDNNYIDSIIPYYTVTNHAISLVGWEDEPEEGGSGYWILRNSWGESSWGEGGYMKIRYNSAAVNLESTYIMPNYWEGESRHVSNDGDITAEPWSAGGTLNAHGVDLWGGAASSVFNSGTINVLAGSSNELSTARGVYLWGGPEGSIINEGQISAFAASLENQAIAYGFCMQGGLAENHGTLNAHAMSGKEMSLAVGIWAANGGNSTEVVNTDSITARATQGSSSHAYGVWADSRSQTKVINSGTIKAQGDDHAVGVLLTGGPAYLSNTGTIEGVAGVDSSGGAGVISVGPSTIINSGTIEGSSFSLQLIKDKNLVSLTEDSKLTGDLSLERSSSFIDNRGAINGDIRGWGKDNIFDNHGAVTGDIDMGSGTVYLRGDSLVTGDVVNNGTLNLDGNFAVSIIDGDYTNHSRATLGVAVGNGQSDRLDVSGTAEIEGGNLRILPRGVVRDGETHEVLKAGAINGRYDSHGIPSMVLSFTESYSTDSLALESHRKPYYEALAGTGLESPNNSAVSSTLMQSIKDSPVGPMANAINTLDRQSSAGALAGAMDQLSSEPYTAGAALGAMNRAGFSENVTSRLESLRTDSFPVGDSAEVSVDETDRKKSDWSPWARFNYTTADQEGGQGFTGYSYDSTAMNLGIDRAFSDRLLLGASLGLASSTAETTRQGAEIEAESIQMGLYGSWNEKAYFIDGSLMLAYSDYDSLRHMPAFSTAARGDYHGRDYSFYLGGGYIWPVQDWNLAPIASLQYTNHREKAFTETGAGALNLDIEGSKARSLLGRAGLRLSRQIKLSKDMKIMPEFTLQWGREFADRCQQAVARFSGGGTPMNISGVSSKRNSALAGAKITALVGDSLSLFASYEGEYRSDFDAHSFRAGLKFSF